MLTTTLPPTIRDFEIHRLALIELVSTRQLAEKYEISQTRVRQIIARVADWLTEMLPVKSEQDIEKEKRYALHLAAAQLRHQIQELENYFNGSGDPKYLRQQTRAITALAHLGASPTTLDSLAPDPDDPRPTQARSASEGPGSQTTLHTSSPSLPLSPSPTPSDSSLSLHDSSFPPPPPPSGDCSPASPCSSIPQPSSFPTSPDNPAPPTDLLLQPEAVPDVLHGFEIMERNLLTYIGHVSPDQIDRLANLNETLSNLRQSRANYVLKLSPNTPVTTAANTERPSPLSAGTV